MSQHEGADTGSVESDVTSQRPRDLYAALAAYVSRADNGDRAALARLRPDNLEPHQLAALSRVLISAGLSPEEWRSQTWPRWALIAQGMALSGHDGKQRLGAQLAQAGVAESRVTKLLTARGEAFVQWLPRLLRLMASKGIAPNWRELGPLVLSESGDALTDSSDFEAMRLRIAGPYFSALSRSNRS